MTSKWIIIILALAVVVMGFFQWKGCSTTDKTMSDTEMRKKINDTIKVVKAHYDSIDAARENIRLIHDSIYKKSLDSSLHLLRVSKDSIKLYKSSYHKAVADLGEMIAELNDSSIQTKYDSMVVKMNRYEQAAEEMASTCDSTIAGLLREKEYQDSIKRDLLGEITGLKSALTACTLNFDGLKTDFDKEAAKVKRQSIIAKIGAGLGVVVGFFLGHSLK